MQGSGPEEAWEAGEGCSLLGEQRRGAAPTKGGVKGALNAADGRARFLRQVQGEGREWWKRRLRAAEPGRDSDLRGSGRLSGEQEASRRRGGGRRQTGLGGAGCGFEAGDTPALGRQP